MQQDRLEPTCRVWSGGHYSRSTHHRQEHFNTLRLVALSSEIQSSVSVLLCLLENRRFSPRELWDHTAIPHEHRYVEWSELESEQPRSSRLAWGVGLTHCLEPGVENASGGSAPKLIITQAHTYTRIYLKDHEPSAPASLSNTTIQYPYPSP